MNRLVVKVKQGWLSGSEARSEDGVAYIAFKGVPFAAPPIGHLRFKDPEPPEKWTGVRNATKVMPGCPQIEWWTKELIGDEDCLYLNIATKSLVGSKPVMVWMHEGAFMMGHGSIDQFGPDYLMNADIVYVSINYRVGIFGFLQLYHEAAAGNMGLKDQVAALKWIQENIAQFGGDPNNVTIFGASAGSASVHYHLISPLSKGLFHKGILHSGAVFNSSARVAKPLEIPYRLAKAFGKHTTDPVEIVELLRTIPADEIIRAQKEVVTLKEGVEWMFAFGPSVDRESPNPFMPWSPSEAAEKGFDVPVIVGYVSDEGLLYLEESSSEVQEHKYVILNNHPEILVPRDIRTQHPSKVPKIADKIRKHYFGDNTVSPETKVALSRCFGDQRYTIGAHKVVEIQMKKQSPTYLFRFTYESLNPITQTLYGLDVSGVCHFEDVTYILRIVPLGQYGRYLAGTTQRLVSDRLVRMWTNFATYGNPTPQVDDLITVKWKPVDSTEKHYLEIDSELTMGTDPDEDTIQFWKSIFQSVYDEPDP